MKKQGNMAQSKEKSKFPETSPKETIYELPHKEWKIVVLKKLSELQEKTDRQPNEIRKTMNEQNETFNRNRNYKKEVNKF